MAVIHIAIANVIIKLVTTTAVRTNHHSLSARFGPMKPAMLTMVNGYATYQLNVLVIRLLRRLQLMSFNSWLGIEGRLPMRTRSATDPE
jgi:hypothetical protein